MEPFATLKTVKLKILCPLPVIIWFQNHWQYSSDRQMERSVVWRLPCTERCCYQNKKLSCQGMLSVCWIIQRLYGHNTAVFDVTEPPILYFLSTSPFLYFTQPSSCKWRYQEFLYAFFYFPHLLCVSCACLVTSFLKNSKRKARYKGEGIWNF
jgi:hypothetical protein